VVSEKQAKQTKQIKKEQKRNLWQRAKKLHEFLKRSFQKLLLDRFQDTDSDTIHNVFAHQQIAIPNATH
jgi:hypothetical protein